MKSVPIALALAGLAVGLPGCISVDLPGPRRGPLAETVVEGEGDAKILLVEIEGLISEQGSPGRFGLLGEESMVARVRAQLEKGARDEDVKGVVLRIHSPGGTTTASEILYREIQAFKETKKVPVVAAFMGTATSGAYYVAMAADAIVAHPTSVTGSIGVIFTGVSFAGLMDKLGIEDQTLVSGPQKDATSPLRRMRPEEKANIQGVLDDLHARFEQVVAKGRPDLDLERVEELADGRIFSATQAEELGLVDRVEDLPGAVDEVRRRAQLDEARVVSYHREREWRENLYSLRSSSSWSLLDWASLWAPGQPPAFLYLWWP